MSDHGYGAYTRGCRCADCREAKRVYVAARRKAGLEIDTRATHGPRNPGVPRVRYNQELARVHVAQLIGDLGWNVNGIARVAACDSRSIRHLLTGRAIQRATGERLRAIPAVPYIRPNSRRVTRHCAFCNGSFTTVPSDVRIHCGYICAARARAGRPGSSRPVWSDAELVRCLIRASEGGVVTTCGYKKWLASNDGPTIKTITSRIGPTWVDAVEHAGLRSGQAVRDYTRRWDEAAILSIVRKAFDEGVTTADDYQEWARGRDDVPSLSLTRMRFGRWSHLVALATAKEAVPA